MLLQSRGTVQGGSGTIPALEFVMKPLTIKDDLVPNSVREPLLQVIQLPTLPLSDLLKNLLELGNLRLVRHCLEILCGRQVIRT